MMQSLFIKNNSYIVDITLTRKKTFEKMFGEAKNITYICGAQGAQKPHCWPKSEKGIRCESGTIPVAVYLGFRSGEFMFVAFFATGKILGRRNKRDESEDLPVHLDDWYLQDTGVNQNLFFQSLFLRRLRA